MAISLESAWGILANIAPMATEQIAAQTAINRVLATDICAKRPHPHQDIAAMDGYGFAAADQAQNLQLVGTAAAGEDYLETVNAGQCVRIFTGAAIPNGVSTVAMQEDCSVDAQQISVPASPKQHFIRQQSGDFAIGTQIALAGAQLSSRDIAVLLAAGWDSIPVIRQAGWRLLATGSELTEAGSQTGTINSNIHALNGLLRQNGATVLSTNSCNDSFALLKDHIAQSLDADVLLMTGGVSVGDKDLVRPCLEALGAEILFHGLLMKPGKPSLLARIGKTWILALPGNPVSAQVCGQLLGLPLLRALTGQQNIAPKFTNAIAHTTMPQGMKRENFLRGYCFHDADGRLWVQPMPNQDSAALLSLAEANCLVRIGINAQAKATGALVQIYLLNDG